MRITHHVDDEEGAVRDAEPRLLEGGEGHGEQLAGRDAALAAAVGAVPHCTNTRAMQIVNRYRTVSH